MIKSKIIFIMQKMTKTAESLNYSPSGISRIINDLEKE